MSEYLNLNLTSLNKTSIDPLHMLRNERTEIDILSAFLLEAKLWIQHNPVLFIGFLFLTLFILLLPGILCQLCSKKLFKTCRNRELDSTADPEQETAYETISPDTESTRPYEKVVKNHLTYFCCQKDF